MDDKNAGDAINQLFLRCQPKQPTSKKAKQKRRLNRAKLPTSSSTSRLGQHAVKIKPQCSGNVSSDYEQNYEASGRRNISNNYNNTTGSNNVGFNSNSRNYLSKSNIETTNTKTSSQSASQLKQLSSSTSTTKKNVKYKASKNLQQQIKNSKKNDKIKLTKNSNKDSSFSEDDCGQTNKMTAKVPETLVDLSAPQEVDKKSSDIAKSSNKVTFKEDLITNKDIAILSPKEPVSSNPPEKSILRKEEPPTESELDRPGGIKKYGSTKSVVKNNSHQNEAVQIEAQKDGLINKSPKNDTPHAPSDTKEQTDGFIGESLIQLNDISGDDIATSKIVLNSIVTCDEVQTDNAANCSKLHGDALNQEIQMSTLQFNSLSDNESLIDDTPDLIESNISNLAALSINGVASEKDLKKDSNNNNSSISNSISTQIKPKTIATSVKEPTLPSTVRNSLSFPKLDEGLSSEAESNYEDSIEEDEGAIDGDVDAGDDDDDDDDENDIDENNDDFCTVQTQNIFPYLQNNAENSQSKMQNATRSQSGNDPHQSGYSQNINQADPLQYSGQSLKNNFQSSSYINQEVQIDQGKNEFYDSLNMNDPKNFQDHNGSSNQNLWMNQTPADQGQRRYRPTGSRQTDMRDKNNSSNLIQNRASNLNYKDESKSVNRLSSDTDNETDRLLGTQRSEQSMKMAKCNGNVTNNLSYNNATTSNKSDNLVVNQKRDQQQNQREVLIEGVLFRVKFLGTTQIECENRAKEDRIQQAEMAIYEVKSKNDPSLPSDVHLFISTEKIMILDNENQKIATTFDLRTISYIADIGDAIVLIVKDCKKSSDYSNDISSRFLTKLSCHVFESTESHTITKSINQAFQFAYAELRKIHGLPEGQYLGRDFDLQDVLNSQEMSLEELEMFAHKENHRKISVPKKSGEILGLTIVESGWGSMLPTVVIASLKPDYPAHRCKQLSIGDQILSVDGNSLVGLSLAECKEYLRQTKKSTVARLVVVPCPITVEVKIRRPDTKIQLGFSVQNGVICSLLRGGIAERGGVRVGHRIMSINGIPVVGVPHDKIVNLLANSVGEIRMKTCLTSLYRLILGEDNPAHD